MALVCLGDIRKAVSVALDVLLVAVFTTAGYKHDLLSAVPRLDVDAVSVLVLTYPAILLAEIVNHAVTVAVDDIKHCRRSRNACNEVESVRVLFQSSAERRCLQYVLTATLAALGHVEPAMKGFIEIIHLFFRERCGDIIHLQNPLCLCPVQASSAYQRAAARRCRCRFPSAQGYRSARGTAYLTRSAFVYFHL